MSKDGYTRISKKYTFTVEANLSAATVELEQSEFTYSGQVCTPKIKSVKIFGHDVPDTAYTVDLSSDTTGTNASNNYSLRIVAASGGGYTGSAIAKWEILPRVLTRVVACDYIKNYDGTTNITVDNIEKMICCHISIMKAETQTELYLSTARITALPIWMQSS